MERELEVAEREALEYVSRMSDTWATALTIAHLRIPRIELLAYDDIEEAYHFEVKLILDKALTAIVANTWPVHE